MTPNDELQTTNILPISPELLRRDAMRETPPEINRSHISYSTHEQVADVFAHDERREELTPEGIVDVLVYEGKTSARRLNGHGVWGKLRTRLMDPPRMKGGSLEHVARAMNRLGFPAWKEGTAAPPSFEPLINSAMPIDGYNVAMETAETARGTPNGLVFLATEKMLDAFEAGKIGPADILGAKFWSLITRMVRQDIDGERQWRPADHRTALHAKVRGMFFTIVTPVLHRRGYDVRWQRENVPVIFRREDTETMKEASAG